MNKKFRQKYTLDEERNQFKKLCQPLNEWSYSPSNMEEDDNNQDLNAPINGQNKPPMNAQQGEQQPSNSMLPMDNGMDNGMDNEMNSQPDANDVNGQGIPQDNSMDDGMGEDMGMNSGEDAGENNMDMPTNDMTNDIPNDTEEIDVDDLTNAQEKLNKKMNSIGKEFNNTNSNVDNLLNALDKMNTIINNNNEQIKDLKAEIERRNPTPIEKLEMRSVNDSYPFNVKPNDYWKDKTKDSNYEIAPDDEKEYTITSDDIDNVSDNDIANSFEDNIDNGLNLKKIFGF